MEATNREFEILTDREHVLIRPGMYLGQITIAEKEMWMYNKETGTFSYQTVSFVPALLKYVSEIVDNSIDVAIDTNFKSGNKIQINIDNKSVEVIDNGIGIPCTDINGSIANPKESCVVAAWTKLKSGTSFTANRKKIGTNGVGASCCNIFSTLFIGESDDGTYKQTLKCANNMTKIEVGGVRKSSGKSGVRVYCEPDLKRFGLTEITEEHINLVYQRLLMLSVSFPQISFTFNKKKISIDKKKFAEMFSDSAETAISENTKIVVFPNEYDEFKSFSYVNGIETFRGGGHVDYITGEITRRMRDKLIKKFKNIKPGDIKNKLSIAIILTDFLDPQFDAQTKESLSATAGDISNHIGGNIDFDKLVKNILKNEAIVEPIVETFRIKEELKTRQEIKKIKKIKVKSDKYMPPIGKEKKYLALCEGASAQSGISASLGREGIGYYAMRGLPLNAYGSSMQKIAANQEFKDIVNILGLEINNNSETKHIDFDKVLITTDADCYDGNTKIYTDTGLKAIKDISYEDKVMSSDGNYYDVTNIVTKHINELVVLHIGQDSVITSPNQSVFVYRKGKIQQVLAKDVTTTDYLLAKSSRSLMCLNISDYERLPVTQASHVESPMTEVLYDITVASEDHTFFIDLPQSHCMMLAHNCDGNHITSMLLGWFKKFAPNLFTEGKICKLITPLIIVVDKKDSITDYFFTVDEFKTWEAKHPDNKNKIIYEKGLGSWDREQLIDLINKNGLENFIQQFSLDETGDIYMEDWLGTESENRKKYLRNYEFDINQV